MVTAQHTATNCTTSIWPLTADHPPAAACGQCFFHFLERHLHAGLPVGNEGCPKADEHYVRIMNHLVKTIINHPMFDGLYHPFIVILGMVYYCFSHISLEMSRISWNGLISSKISKSYISKSLSQVMQSGLESSKKHDPSYGYVWKWGIPPIIAI
jgi:hypothetical protein